MPRCENDTVYLPSKAMCKNCEDEKLFPPTCKNDILELKFNNTEMCMEPLVKTDQVESFHPDIEGCGLSCKDAYYTDNEHKQIHKLVGYCVLICIFLTLFTVITFVIDWKTANKYPALAIFYINVCFLVSYSGWMIQFLGMETREDIVCKKDGTLRKSEPSATENLSCVIVFVMVYYFLIAGLVWFVIFTYCWHMSSLQALGKIQERVDKKRAYFHLVSWSFPLILTITTMALGEIDGDYISGICFVGFINTTARTGLLLAPLAVAVSLGGYIIIRGLILLIRVKIESRDIISVHSSRKIRSNIVRMGVFALFMFVFSIITFIYHGYRSMNYETWEKSLQSYIWCKIISTTTENTNCKMQNRPSVAMLQLQLIAVFGSGIAMASWIWCGATLHSWARYIRRKFHCEIEEPMKLQKHKIIAQAFAKRKKFNQDGRISIECQNHTDPVGLHFDLNSAASNELSTTWAANLPRLVNRRGAVPNEVPCSVSSNNQSIDSEMSYSVRHVSIESRRNSGDSQLSVQIAELKATRKINGRRHRNRYRHKKHNFRRGSRDLTKKLSKTGLKRESSTSLESHLGAQLLNVLSNNSSTAKNFAPNLKRRAGNAGLDGQHINNLLSNGKLVIPYNIQNIKSGSEDENVSVTFSESKFNVVVSNHNLDLNDQLVMKSLRQGLHIEEMKSSDSQDEDAMKKDWDQEKRDSRSSRRSRRLRRSKIQYPTDDDSDSYDDEEKNLNCRRSDDSSSCPELKRLVQSSLNSGASTACTGCAFPRNKAVIVLMIESSNGISSRTIRHSINDERSYLGELWVRKC
ncbi:smo [Trypoxylus dichotomus]